MKSVLVVIVSILMFGCTAPIVQVNLPNLEKSTNYQIGDLRPQSEKESEIFSISITNDAYGTYRQGDQTNPGPLRILQHRIHEKFSDNGKLPDVKVHHFVTYMNLQSELRRGVLGGVLGGVVGSVIASSTQKYGVDGIAELVSQDEFEAFEDEYKRALYTETENPNKVSVLTVYIDAEIDGKRKFIKTMTPTRLENQPDKIPVVVAIETAIAYYLDQYKA